MQADVEEEHGCRAQPSRHLSSALQADEFSGQMNPVGGLVYYISAPESLAAAAANPLHTLFYVAFMLGSECSVCDTVGFQNVCFPCMLKWGTPSRAALSFEGKHACPAAPLLPRSLRRVFHHLD